MKTVSRQIVDWLMTKDNRINRLGFNKAVLAVFARDTENVTDDDVDYLKLHLGCVPDAWLIDEPNKTVIWYEVEDSHRLSNDKIKRLYMIYFALDCCFWKMEVIVYNRYGHGGPIGLTKIGTKLVYYSDDSKQRTNRRA